jgi:hypothetical protein
MPQPKGFFLYVNLPAAKVRERLKGFGHGVRKIQSGGRKQAVVIHTATGKHLEQLMAKFADVGCSSTPGDIGEPVETLRNLGDASGQALRAVGIRTIDDLRRVGPAAAFRLIKRVRPDATISWLWAIAAGLQGRHLYELSGEEKIALRSELDDLR